MKSEQNPPVSVDLGGDGDELLAIDDVEEAFGVTLDKRDVDTWRTAGDVYRSLANELSEDEGSAPETWDRFADVLTQSTGTDGRLIQPESPLLAPPIKWGHVTTYVAYPFWAALALLAIALVFGLTL